MSRGRLGLLDICLKVRNPYEVAAMPSPSRMNNLKTKDNKEIPFWEGLNN